MDGGGQDVCSCDQFVLNSLLNIIFYLLKDIEVVSPSTQDIVDQSPTDIEFLKPMLILIFEVLKNPRTIFCLIYIYIQSFFFNRST